MSSTPSRIPMLVAALALGVAAPAAAQTPAAPPAGPTGGSEATVDRPGLTVKPGSLLNRTVRIRGTADVADAGRAVVVERMDAAGAWGVVATTQVVDDGTFTALWKTDRLGRVPLRATVDRGPQASAATAPLTAEVTVFKPAVASWYGPGFFGKRTACGSRITRRTVGVAHRTLPCGTSVDVYYAGRTLSVPVIDRGPFVAGRDWDLTQAAAELLGVRATVRIGFLPPADVPLHARSKSRRG